MGYVHCGMNRQELQNLFQINDRVEFRNESDTVDAISRMLGFTTRFDRISFGTQTSVVDNDRPFLQNQTVIVPYGNGIVAVQRHYPHLFENNNNFPFHQNAPEQQDLRLHYHIRPAELILPGTYNYRAAEALATTPNNQTNGEQFVITPYEHAGQNVIARVDGHGAVGGFPTHIFTNLEPAISRNPADLQEAAFHQYQTTQEQWQQQGSTDQPFLQNEIRGNAYQFQEGGGGQGRVEFVIPDGQMLGGLTGENTALMPQYEAIRFENILQRTLGNYVQH